MSKQTISYSELNDFAQCRQRWLYRYVLNLSSKVTAEPLSAGSACHAALEAYYKGADWRQAIRDWRDNALTKYVTDAPVLPQNDTEDDDFYDEAIVDLSAICEAAEQIIERYILRYEEEDRTWKILEVEKRFEIPIPNTEYLLVGVFDLLVEDEHGRTWLVDHKFVGNTFRDYESLELDTQIGIYQWAAQQLGYNALGFIYNQIRRTLPKVPTVIKTKNKFGGKLSVSEIYTDWETFKEQIELNGEEHLLEAYREEMIPKLEKKVFFDRKHIYRSQKEIDNFYLQLRRRMSDFVTVQEDVEFKSQFGHQSPLIYMNPERFNCGFCAFKPLCVENLKGNDISYMIEQEYERRVK